MKAKVLDPTLDPDTSYPWDPIRTVCLCIVCLVGFAMVWWGTTVFLTSPLRPEVITADRYAGMTCALVGAVMSVIVCRSIIRRNIIGVKSLVGLSFAHLANPTDEVLFLQANRHETSFVAAQFAIFSSIRLGGWGNTERLYPIYMTQAYQAFPTNLHLRVTGRLQFQIVDQKSGQSVGAGLHTLLRYVYGYADNKLDLFTPAYQLRETKAREQILEQEWEQLGLALFSIRERLKALRPAADSPHAEVTNMLCDYGLGSFRPEVLVHWRHEAYQKWGHLFKAPKRGDKTRVTREPPVAVS